MKQYLEALEYILQHGEDKNYNIEEDTRSVFGYQMRFNMADGFPAVTTKKLFFKGVAGELLWFISGSSDNVELNKLGVHIWDDDADKELWRSKARFEGDLGRIYGVQWRHWRRADGTEVDQLGEIIKRIRQKPNDRRHIVTAWNPGELDEMALPPCHIMYQFYVANGKLSLQMYQRSADMFLGVPFNIASYALLLHMVAQVTGFKAHEFVYTLGDTHIYKNHIHQVKEVLGRKPLKLPTLWLDPEVKEINDFTMNHIELMSYKSHPPIKADMSVNTVFDWDTIY